MPISDKFIEPKLENEKKYLKALIYAPSGAGKTTLLVSNVIPGVTKGLKTLVLLTEKQGLMSIDYAQKKGWVHPESKVLVIESLQDLREVLDYLKTDDHGFELVGLDTLDDLQELIKREIKGKKTKNKDVTTMKDWGEIIEKIRNIVTLFRDIDTHFICLTHVKETVVDDIIYQKPAIAGKNQPDVIAGLVNIVGLMRKQVDSTSGKITRKVVFLADDSIQTKELASILPVEDAWFPLWLEKIYNNIPREYTIKDFVNSKKEVEETANKTTKKSTNKTTKKSTNKTTKK